MHLSIFLRLIASGEFIQFLLLLQRNKMLQVDLNETVNALECCLCRLCCDFCNTCIYFFIWRLSRTHASSISMFNIILKGYSTWIFVFEHDSCFCYYLEISLYIISLNFFLSESDVSFQRNKPTGLPDFVNVQQAISWAMSLISNLCSGILIFSNFTVWYNNVSDKSDYIFGIRTESNRLDFLQYFVSYSQLKDDYNMLCRIT